MSEAQAENNEAKSAAQDLRLEAQALYEKADKTDIRAASLREKAGALLRYAELLERDTLPF